MAALLGRLYKFLEIQIQTQEEQHPSCIRQSFPTMLLLKLEKDTQGEQRQEKWPKIFIRFKAILIKIMARMQRVIETIVFDAKMKISNELQENWAQIRGIY